MVRTPKLPRPWTPQQDNDQAAAYSSPEEQNIGFINKGRTDMKNIMGLQEWKDYDSVLAGRNAHMGMPHYDLRSSLPAGYTEGAFDQELDSFANTGRVGGQGMQQGALRGLETAAGLKPNERAKIAGRVRQNALPGGRII